MDNFKGGEDIVEENKTEMAPKKKKDKDDKGKVEDTIMTTDDTNNEKVAVQTLVTLPHLSPSVNPANLRGVL